MAYLQYLALIYRVRVHGKTNDSAKYKPDTLFSDMV